MKPLILSSISPARKTLLARLGIPFKVMAPNIDETPVLNEQPIDLVQRLALEKAKVHQDTCPNSLIIGSDQVALLKNKILGKPLTYTKAVEMLMEASDQSAYFYTGLCLYNTETKQFQITTETYIVKYRRLTLAMVESYLKKEQPYQCAGSIKVEGLGIALIEELIGKDPSALTGLPLIALVKMLENEGIRVI